MNNDSVRLAHQNEYLERELLTPPHFGPGDLLNDAKVVLKETLDQPATEHNYRAGIKLALASMLKHLGRTHTYTTTARERDWQWLDEFLDVELPGWRNMSSRERSESLQALKNAGKYRYLEEPAGGKIGLRHAVRVLDTYYCKVVF